MSSRIHHIWDSMDAVDKAVTVGSLTILALVLFFSLIYGMSMSSKRSEMEARLQIDLTLSELHRRPGRK